MGQKALEYCAKMSLHLDGSMHRNFRDQICGKSTGDGKNMAFDGIDFLPFCRCSFGSAVFYRNGSIWNRTWSFGFLVSEKGGGKVIIPEGTYDTGAITLKDNVNLCLEDKKTKLQFTQDINHDNYPLVYSHWEGQPMYNYSAFIYAKDAVNIALTGQGTLDGQAGDGTPWCWMSRDYMTDYQDDDRTALINMNNNRVPVEERIFGQGHFLRPNFIQVIGCENVLVEGITLVRSPMWEVNPVLCTNVTVRGIHISTKAANNDGIDPESSNVKPRGPGNHPAGGI